MSPFEVLPLPYDSHSYGPLPPLSPEYGVSSNGFLPEKTPLETLPDPYYAPWESLVQHLAQFLQEQTLRERVDKLPVLCLSRLTTEREWRRAYLILTLLAHGYIWGGDMPTEVLPPPITVPLLKVSELLGLPPVATYASLNLWNYHSAKSDPTDLDSLHALHTFTGTEDESWFYMVSVAMEAQGAHIIPLMVHALEIIQHLGPDGTRSNYMFVVNALHAITRCIANIGALLNRMDEKCDPGVFYHSIRPFLAGSKNMAAAGLPRGVFYDQGHGKGQWRQLRGGSNGQSSLIQFLDVVLGVEHTSQGSSDPERPVTVTTTATATKHGHHTSESTNMSFHEEVRGCMPRQHRRFLEHVAGIGGGGGIRRAIARLMMAACKGEETTAEPEVVELQTAFQAATRALTEFRNRHLQIVTRYIIIPSRLQSQATPLKGGPVNLATASARGRPTEMTAGGSDGGAETAELTGTGGTALLPFLKQTRDETYKAGIIVK
ncbi:Indoleamine 2,3-dioxygenase [Apodospora peruviana]|uniref:Indoleamine 2,3-dioxygenase n=1 Tax=Apodospora peruviana TaxID=516989 RepID=A0AAE0LZM8_9PEZI|nr:Indoleamine 2,3-dioxygenase [Apodospora peruviana]